MTRKHLLHALNRIHLPPALTRKYLLPALIILLITSCSTTPKEEWRELFNGHDLEGWVIKIKGSPAGENYLNTFRVADGVMRVDYSEYDSFRLEYGHIFYHKPFSSYRLRVEYRFTGSQLPGGPGWAYRNSGIMFHCQEPETMGLHQEWPVSIEAQFLGSSAERETTTMNVCTPHTHIVIAGELITDHCISSLSDYFYDDEWVTAELVVYGDSLIHHLVNGDTVLTYSKPQIGGELPEGYDLPQGTPLRSGYIALQSESHPVEFRKVELLDLTKRKREKRER